MNGRIQTKMVNDETEPRSTLKPLNIIQMSKPSLAISADQANFTKRSQTAPRLSFLLKLRITEMRALDRALARASHSSISSVTLAPRKAPPVRNIMRGSMKPRSLSPPFPLGIKTIAKHKTHQKSKHKGRVHKCEECPRVFYFAHLLSDHVNAEHKGLNNHPCQLCTAAFGYRIQLNNHMNYVHNYEKTSKETVNPTVVENELLQKKDDVSVTQNKENGKKNAKNESDTTTASEESIKAKHNFTKDGRERMTFAQLDQEQPAMDQNGPISINSGNGTGSEDEHVEQAKTAKRKGSAVDQSPLSKRERVRTHNINNIANNVSSEDESLNLNASSLSHAQGEPSAPSEKQTSSPEKSANACEDDDIEIIDEITFNSKISCPAKKSNEAVQYNPNKYTKPSTYGETSKSGESILTTCLNVVQQGTATTEPLEEINIETEVSSKVNNTVQPAVMDVADIKTEEERGAIRNIGLLSTKKLRKLIQMQNLEISLLLRRESDLRTRLKFIPLEKRQYVLDLEKNQYLRTQHGESPAYDAKEQSLQFKLGELNTEEQKIQVGLVEIAFNRRQVDLDLEKLQLVLTIKKEEEGTSNAILVLA